MAKNIKLNEWVGLSNKTNKPFVCGTLDYAKKETLLDETHKISDIKSLVVAVGITGVSTLVEQIYVGSFRLDFDSYSTDDKYNNYVALVQCEFLPVDAVVKVTQINFNDGSYINDIKDGLPLTLTIKERE